MHFDANILDEDSYGSYADLREMTAVHVVSLFEKPDLVARRYLWG